MRRNITASFLAVMLFCTIMFLGCATVPKEEMEEKDAIIQNLNNQIENLKQEINRLKQSNKELMDAKAELEERLIESQKAQQQKPIDEKTEPRIK